MTHTHYHHHTGQLVQEGNNVANWLKGRIESDSGGKISRITSTHTQTTQRHNKDTLIPNDQITPMNIPDHLCTHTSHNHIETL